MKKIFTLIFAIAFCQIMMAQDVFYIISTNVMQAHDDNGNEIYNSRLTPSDTLALFAEKEFVRTHYAEGLRFFAPYYEQFTMRALIAPRDTMVKAYEHSKADIKRQFNEYINKQNGGRPYVLMGFSQGAMLVLDLLKEMSDEDYANCKGVYAIGYRIAEQDTTGTRVRPATDALSGNIVSFNSTMTPETTWDAIAGNAITCINPLNWRTDSIPATMTYEGDTLTVSVHPTLNELIVEGIDVNKYTMPGAEPYYKPGCLHHWDILFYIDEIKKNIRERLTK